MADGKEPFRETTNFIDPMIDGLLQARAARTLALLALALTAACSGPVKLTYVDRLEPCTSEQGPSDAYCGSLEVAENPDDPDGRKIALNTVVLPSFSADSQPDPVFFLAGGPGQGAAALAGRIDGLFQQIRRQRDIVLVDQRGTGKSNLFQCKFREDVDALKDAPTLTEAEVEKCLAAFDGDPRFYTTTIAMDDLDAVRDWLGYERINAMGGSYGTRAALVYLRQHPEHVRTVVLDGVAPTDMTLPLYFPRDSQRALNRLLETCSNDSGCSERFPNRKDRLDKLLADLERNVAIRHPRTGEETEATISRRMVAMTVRMALYTPLAGSLVPLVIDQASKGEFGPLTGLMSSGEGLEDEIANGMYLSVTCSEDYPRLSQESVDSESAGTFIGRDVYDGSTEACQYWPRGEVDSSYYEPVRSDLPVLILSGELDPVTPPSWGDEVAQHLPNSRHIVAPGTGHGVMSVGCGMRLIGEFLDTANAAELDASCLDVQAQPPFFLNFSGPYAVQEKEATE